MWLPMSHTLGAGFFLGGEILCQDVKNKNGLLCSNITLFFYTKSPKFQEKNFKFFLPHLDSDFSLVTFKNYF